jgi:cation diffusion facilitator CzcD-associated flavoprotein CzcO
VTTPRKVAFIQQLEQTANSVRTEYFDVLIVGAGLSGVAAAYHLQSRCAAKSFAILEARDAIGGTWDLFRYPGVRSDSDMFTLGYGFRPWPNAKSIADGPAILEYVRDTASEYRIDRKIRFGQRVTSASWSSADALWTLEVHAGPEKPVIRYTCSFLYNCSGYYDYAEGYTPEWPDFERFGGRIVHPQQWPADLDYAGKQVLIIGSGATAVTLAPEMAKTAAHVTILQRSPTYVVSRPAVDTIAEWFQRRLPARLAGSLMRWKNVMLGMYFYRLCRRKPERVKHGIIKLVRDHLGPDYDVATHFTPAYNPWDQRLCLVPDADLFAAIRTGDVSIVTDQIERFTETGLLLRSGKELAADVIVTATGLKMRLMGGIELRVDGNPVDLGKTLSYKGMMFSDVPNLASAFGYTNASWTLKCELIAKYVCRLLNYMDARGYAYCTPRRDPAIGEEASLGMTSGYIQRAAALLPKQGTRKPWKLYQNYLLDMATLRFGKVTDPSMEFTRSAAKAGRNRFKALRVMV